MSISDAGLAEVRESVVVASEEVDHFRGLTRPGGLEGRAEDIDREMDLDDFDLLPGGRGPAHSQGVLESVTSIAAGLGLARDPSAAEVALAELGRAFRVAGN